MQVPPNPHQLHCGQDNPAPNCLYFEQTLFLDSGKDGYFDVAANSLVYPTADYGPGEKHRCSPHLARHPRRWECGWQRADADETDPVCFLRI